MVKFLEERLLEKTKDSQSSILYAQWNYDKKVIPGALQAVTSLFPHYSLHDESHSITIINNIVRIIGKENVEKLSAIDIWLILEASYCHDVGMVVSSQDQIKALKSREFLDFFEEAINDTKHGLHEFAFKFVIKNDQINLKEPFVDLGVYDGIRFILAEYFRWSHSERSKEIINNPFKELSIDSPRGVIPPRIFKILGEICSSHTKDFGEVMKLPFVEVGIDNEDAHPRYIACLLRIGDLLDLDNNRFSEVMLRTLNKVPVDTLYHKQKHLSIESFRADRDKIEVVARCNDYDVANVTQHWFNYLNTEVSQQINRWNEIVPNKDLGYLPMIGELKVELFEYDYIDGKSKPKFSVDTDKALELLQGSGLYENPYQCLREILQNAVDATLLRIWLEFNETKEFSSPQSEDFKKILKIFPISIRISEKNDEKELDYKSWEIEISDNGLGMTSNDLKFLTKTGSSIKNKEKMGIVKSMPIWMQPSGVFGIGFQSIFMITDLVNIETKSYINEEFRIVELNSPSSFRDGGILLKKRRTSHSVKPGTKLTFLIKVPAIPPKVSFSLNDGKAARFFKNFDPFSIDSLDIEIGKILDEIYDFTNKSYIPIKLNMENSFERLEVSNSNKFKYYNSEHCLEFSIKDDFKSNTKVFYKNQIAEINLDIKFLSFDLNIHKDIASKVLTLNRNKVRKEYYGELESQLFGSVLHEMINNFEEIFEDNKKKQLGSMFLHYYYEKSNYPQLGLDRFNYWKDFEINVENEVKSLNDLLSTVEQIKIIRTKKARGFFADDFSLDKASNILVIRLSMWNISNDITHFLIFKAKTLFPYLGFHTSETEENQEIVLTKDNRDEYFSKKEVLEALKNTRRGWYSSRAIIPCSSEYFALRLKEKSNLPYVYRYKIFSDLPITFPEMLSPYTYHKDKHGRETFQFVINEKLIKWVFENRYNKLTTYHEIQESYEKFRIDFDRDISIA